MYHSLMNKLSTVSNRQRCDKCGGVTKLLTNKGAWQDCDKCCGEGYFDLIKLEKKRLSMGRPTTYTHEVGLIICARVASHPEGLQAICEMYDDMPVRSTINKWKSEISSFSDMYLIAQQKKVHLLVEQLNEEMDKTVLYYVDDKGNSRIDAPSVALATAKANNNKWFASKIARATYGDKEKSIENLSEQNSQLLELVAKLTKDYKSDV